MNTPVFPSLDDIYCTKRKVDIVCELRFDCNSGHDWNLNSADDASQILYLLLCGFTAYGHTAYGHMAYGHTAYGHTAYGHTAYGHTAYGHTTYGHTDVVSTKGLKNKANTLQSRAVVNTIRPKD